ncbi:hypothetical protein BH10PSE15_BH10PSE15_07700 [soil metagenome]
MIAKLLAAALLSLPPTAQAETLSWRDRRSVEIMEAPHAFTKPGLANMEPAAIYTDPPHDAAAPARMEVLHIPSHGVLINGVGYLAAGKGPHPTLVLLHGLPGNEKNLDLAQAVRRAGWNVVTFNYRGSWGSPGAYSFAHCIEDTDAVLDWLKQPAQAVKYGIDPAHLVLGGHSLGGWATAQVAAHRTDLKGAILISAADMGRLADAPREQRIAFLADNHETLQATNEALADEIGTNPGFVLGTTAPGLAKTPLLVLTSDDGLAPVDDALVAKVRAAGNIKVETLHATTDHSYSDARIWLESAVLTWLAKLG